MYNVIIPIKSLCANGLFRLVIQQPTYQKLFVNQFAISFLQIVMEIIKFVK